LGLGHLSFQLVKPGSEELRSSGFDVTIIRNGVIAECRTMLTDLPK
jgi:hypothetical protein